MHIAELVPAGHQIQLSCRPHPMVLVGPTGQGVGLLLGSSLLLGIPAALQPSLTTLETTVPTLASFVTGLPWIFALGAGCVALSGLLRLLVGWAQWQRTWYALTQPLAPDSGGGYLIHLWGVLSPDWQVLPLAQINRLTIQRSWLGTLGDYGTLEVRTGNDQVQRLPGVPQLRSFYRLCLGGRSYPSSDGSPLAGRGS